jgi:hypothetical protein
MASTIPPTPILQNRDNTPHANSSECADDNQGGSHEGEVHKTLAMRH